MKIEATLRKGSSYFWRGPMMLWGTAMTYSKLKIRAMSRTISSDATLERA